LPLEDDEDLNDELEEEVDDDDEDFINIVVVGSLTLQKQSGRGL
jgi:hypothetical protein